MSIHIASPSPVARRPRFARRERKTNVVITERDLQILAGLVLDRIQSAEQIARRVAPDAAPCPACKGSGVIADAETRRDVHDPLCLGTGRAGAKRLISRIGDLWAAGYLDRPPMQYDWWRPGGSQRLCYALANDGARALARAGAYTLEGTVDFTQRNDSASKKFVHHSLAIAELSVGLQVGVHRRPAVSLLQGAPLAATLPDEAQAAQYPFKLRARIELGGTTDFAAVIPDRAFTLSFPSRDPRKAADTRGFLAELDLGTMPVSRQTFHQTCIVKKLLIYDHAFRAGEVEKRLDWKFFRVPIVTTTAARRDAILAAITAHRLLRTSRLFMVTTLDAIAGADDILTLPWHRPSGATETLIPERLF